MSHYPRNPTTLYNYVFPLAPSVLTLPSIRKLKPSACPVETPDDPYRLISTTDCHFMDFESVSEATRLWIKGHKFTVVRLLGGVYKHEAERYTGGPRHASLETLVWVSMGIGTGTRKSGW
ncbi:Phosphatidylserine decarboxylase proenzyme 2 [Mycena venus]|uniref:Phosphatidylserine decarboxylase proenzyme 2 n=1 Tax=Mycena venus TaxID=2733690 RepID=A0A8H6Z7U2_9AGAR|nr:Phosphatidylserine decarboxylase proenzyme 2 [Mycena venus]